MPLLNRQCSLENSSRECEQPLRLAVEACVSMARTAKRPAVLRVIRPGLPVALDPWAIDTRELGVSKNGPWVWWHDDRSGATFAAFESALDHQLPAENRFANASAIVAQWGERIIDFTIPPDTTTTDTTASAIVDADEIGWPEIVAGFAFHRPRHGHHLGRAGNPWNDWAAGWMVLPRLLVAKIGSAVRATVAEIVTPADTVADVMERIADALARIEAAAAVATATPPARSSLANPPRPSRRRADESVESGWKATAAQARDTVRRGAMKKIVLARAEHFQAPETTTFDPTRTAQNLRAAQPGCVTFAIGHPDGSAFVGATPEILVRADAAGVFCTMALAGTCRRTADADENAALAQALLCSAKDRDEHDIVVQAMQRALAPIAESLTVAESPRISAFATVQHLETPIEGRLRADRNLLHVVEALHPTPAVGGLPAAEALNWLDSHEAFDRGWYAGPIGWLSRRAAAGCFAVAIRSALLRRRDAWGFAGAGIVAESDPTAEWDETTLKLATVADALVCRVAECAPCESVALNLNPISRP